MLTEKRIRDARAADKTTFIWDSRVNNFGVRITGKGAKSYVLFYRTGGRKHLATLARCSEVSLAEARQRAGRELAAIRDGEADPLERRRKTREAPTVNDALDRFFNETAPARIEAGRMTERTMREYGKQATRYVRPSLGTLHVAKVSRHDIERFAATMAKTPAQRNRTLAFVSRLFTLAEHWEWRDQRTNPVRGVTRAREQARDRVLEPTELARLNAALESLETQHPFPVAAIRVAAMTGLRISECLSLSWANVSFETARAILPTTKVGRRVVPLAAPVLDILSGLPRINGNPWVFAGGRGAAVTYRTTRRVFAEACGMAGLEDVRLHDLRRSIATSLAASGVNAFTLRDVLGHATVTMSNRYVRAASVALTEATERAAAMTAAAMEGKSGEIVPMERRNG